MACGIFLYQGSNPCLLQWQADSLPLNHLGSPARQILNPWITREASFLSFLCQTLLNCTLLFLPTYFSSSHFLYNPLNETPALQNTFHFRGDFPHPGLSLLYFCVCLSTVGYFLFLELLSSLGFRDLLSLGFYPVSPGAPCLYGLLTFLLPTLQGSVVSKSPVLSTLEFSLFPLWSPLLSWIPPSSLHPHDLFIEIYAFISAAYPECQDCF